MEKLKAAWRSLFDVRPGEYGRTVFMSLYLLFVLFAYYVLKSASEAMFLNKFDIDKLPDLYIYMAIFGGGLAVVYSKLAAKTSLKTAVSWTMFVSVACLVGMWFPLRTRNATIVYVFAVWVRLFSIVSVTQGWLVASNLFNSREAKRVYGLLGMGMIVGVVFGGEFTNRTVKLIGGADNLLFASAALVVVAYMCFLLAITRKGVSLAGASAAEGEQGDFSFRDVVTDIGRSRHLQVLIAIMTMQFIIDTLIDYQFKYMAKAAYRGQEAALAAFLGRFYGRYLPSAELGLQFFFTTLIVRRLGVGGTMQIMPVSLAAASVFTVASPSLLSAASARLVEASTRYTLARTGNELFYLPLPLALRNRIKAFIDIFVDRAARGISGLLLKLLIQMSIGVQGVAAIVVGVTVPWIFLTIRAQREYIRTIRGRLEARRLDLEGARITVGDADTIRLLETAARGTNPRQAAYALSLLGSAAGYDLEPLLIELAASPHAEVRAEVYAQGRQAQVGTLLGRALEEVRLETTGVAARQAVVYLLTVSPDRSGLFGDLLDHPSPVIQEGVIEALAEQPQTAAEMVPHEWISRTSRDPDPRRRVLAARTLAICGDRGTEAIHQLLADPDAQVSAAACGAAGALRNRAYVFALARLLANPRVRGAAIEALAQYGPAICGTLGDILDDDKLPVSVRSQVPRVLKLIPNQHSVDVLMPAIGHLEVQIRVAALKGLNRLRETSPGLRFEDAMLTQRILNEALQYFETSAALASLAPHRASPHTAVSLLASTLEERLRRTLERLFRLLGLRYPPKEMYWTYLAISRRKLDNRSTAVEFLDNVLSQDLKRVVLPLLEAPERLLDRARDLFGVQVQDAESTIRALVHSEDPWVVACAIAAAAQLKLSALVPDIALAAERFATDIAQVARSARSALA